MRGALGYRYNITGERESRENNTAREVKSLLQQLEEYFDRLLEGQENSATLPPFLRESRVIPARPKYGQCCAG